MEGARDAVLRRIGEVRAQHRRLHWVGGALVVAFLALIVASLVWADGDATSDLLVFAVPIFFFLGAVDLFRTEQVKDLEAVARDLGAHPGATADLSTVDDK